MIALNNISFEFGGRYLYKNANWHIKPGERIGLIGRNGTGKSTLLRVINGEYSLSGGSISKPKDLSIGFLNQDLLSFEIEESILNVAMTAFQRQLDLEKEIEEVLVKLETDHSDEIINLLADKQHEFENLDGYNIKHKCEKILEGLGFRTEQLEQPFKLFSGGWRMRVMLAKLLLQRPNLLMLDEPTNHLDLPTIEWLENYLQGYEGTVIVVSHDREFLDKMITKTVEVANQRLYEYAGNYSFFLDSKLERDELQQRQFDNQQQFIKDQEKLINRFKAKASKAAMAQSRMKMLDKIDKIEAPEEDNADINIKFKLAFQSGRVVAEIDNVSKSFPMVEIVHNATARIEKGDKIALIGANGKGKSTLLRMIAGTEPFDGKISRGHNVTEAFYAQHQLESLNVNVEILEELSHHASDRPETELRTVLGCFLFTGDDVFKKIKVLSGGEKARVALAKTLLTESNFLLLDEPTNHLDMRSINILIKALQQYEGTFITVSHDRFFVSSIANKIWWIEDEELKEYLGTYHEWEEWNHKRLEEKQKHEKLNPLIVQKIKEKKIDVMSDDKNKPSKNHIQSIRKNFEIIEAEVEKIKHEISTIELSFADTNISSNSNKVLELNKVLNMLKKELLIKEVAYEKAFEELIAVEG
ncbi:MAG: ABC-F family ATP-binding cassette domain-containing protein [Bacteroidetes bacterium]|nr:ABC-F family ATP-binding cassette domain-containing protein [Bacteroidota bacterium]